MIPKTSGVVVVVVVVVVFSPAVSAYTQRLKSVSKKQVDQPFQCP